LLSNFFPFLFVLVQYFPVLVCFLHAALSLKILDPHVMTAGEKNQSFEARLA